LWLKFHIHQHQVVVQKRKRGAENLFLLSGLWKAFEKNKQQLHAIPSGMTQKMSAHPLS